MTSYNAPEVAAAASTKKRALRPLHVGIAAALLLSCSSIALHAETSNGELAREIAELKAQIRELRGSVSATRSETRREVQKVRAARGPVAPLPSPAFAALPEGATPVFVTADKKMQYGSLTITPGGFVAMESVFRTRDTQGDIGTGFNTIPTNNLGPAHLNEDRFSARQSRIALLIESPISSSLLVSGYGEFDFLGAGTTSNNNQTYGYVPRIRNLYATLDSTDYGFHVLAGQNWSLVTLNSKGITPRNEVPPPQIDANFIPGFIYGRIPQIRITKDFNKKLWLSLDAEASQTVGNNGGCANIVSNTANATVTNVAAANNATGAVAAANSIQANAATGVLAGNCEGAGTGVGFGGQGTSQQLSFNKVPDVLGKVAYEARLADRDIHLEGFGVYRDLLDNVNYNPAAVASTGLNAGGFANSGNQNTTAYGVGAGVIIPLIPRTLDFQASGLVGRGLGRYTSSGLPDATVNGNGSFKALGAADALIGVTYHVTPSIDLWAFGGFEQVNRNFTTNAAGVQVGYGLTNGVNNTGCNNEGGICQGQTHRIFQITGGMWDKLYKGNFGEVRVGVQYSYTQRQLFGATAAANGVATAANPFVSAKADEQMVLTSFRYYPFQ